ncbi:MAG: acyl-CoA synthetase (AMP-forming)/AMP-acid ligase II [Chlamydiales bacterium]|jgi:acyl-CoA synthetase (AMP-forming)/AMP-acid ligase II
MVNVNRKNCIISRILYNEKHDCHRPFLRRIDNKGDVSSYTYREIVNEAKKWAAHFSSLTLPLSSQIIICLPHSLDLYTSYLGAVLSGRVWDNLGAMQSGG